MKKFVKFLFVALFALTLIGCTTGGGGGTTTTTEYSVKFDYNDGSEVQVVKVKKGETVAKPTDPTREGYKFVEWQNSNKAYDFSKPVTKSMTLKAKWEKEGSIGEKSCSEDRNQDKCLDPTTFDWDYNRFGFDGKKMEIKIYVGIAAENDPSQTGFTGERREDRQRVRTDVEAAYNVTIKYEEYPADAAWGPSRVAWIQNQKTVNKYSGHIFLIDSNWISTLKKNGSIAELYNTSKKTGLFKDINYEQDPSFLKMTSANGKVYGYSNGSVRPDTFLYYNQDLVDKLGLEDPATLWNEGKWDYAKFVEFADAAKAQLGDESTVLSGEYVRMAQGFLAASGGRFVDAETNTVLLTNQKTLDTFNNLKNLYAKGQIDKASGSNDVSDKFREGKAIFNTGSLWFLSSTLRFKDQCDFKISVVPYPTAEGDGAAKETFQIPMGYEATWAFQPVENGENGLSTKVLLNMLDDLFAAVPPESKTTSLDKEAKYRAFLAKRIDSEASVNALMSVQASKYQYLDLLELVSMTAGEGSHYKLNGFWLNFPSLKEDGDPASQLAALQPIYQKTLEEINFN